MIDCVYYHPQKTIVARWNLDTFHAPTLLDYRELPVLATDDNGLYLAQDEPSAICIPAQDTIMLRLPNPDRGSTQNQIQFEQDLWFNNTQSIAEEIVLHSHEKYPQTVLLLTPTKRPTLQGARVFSDVYATVNTLQQLARSMQTPVFAVGVLSNTLWVCKVHHSFGVCMLNSLQLQNNLDSEILKVVSNSPFAELENSKVVILFGDGISKKLVETVQQQTQRSVGRLNPFFEVHSQLRPEQQHQCLQHAHVLSAIVYPVLQCESLAAV